MCLVFVAVVCLLHVQKLLSDTLTRRSHHVVALLVGSSGLVVVRVSIVNHCSPLDLNHVL